MLLASSARAQLARLETPPGDGGVSVEVDAYGAFGYTTFGSGSGGAGDATYDPVGPVGPSSTTWESAVYLRMPPQSVFLTIGTAGQGTPGGLPDPGFLSTTTTSATSAFDHAGLQWELTQTVRDLLVAGSRVGTLLVQEYLIRNPSPTSVTFDLVRYYEGDLFLGLGAGVPDGGGRLLVGGEELLFETDLAGEPAATTNLVGITACGGTTPVQGRYEVNAWPAFPGRITADLPLGDIVFNDGGDADEFVDAGLDYDVGIALANELDLAPGQATLYITTTVFGTLPPDDVSEGCGVITRAIADAGADVTACPGALVRLDGSASFDPDTPDGGVMPSWTWDLDVTVDSDANGVADDDADALGETVASPFPLGATTVQLTYVDDDGDVSRDLVTVTVADDLPPSLDCPAEITVAALSFAGAPASPTAMASDDCEPVPGISNDRTGRGADASDDYPCGSTLVTFTAWDAVGNEGTCATIVRVLAAPLSWEVGPALRLSRETGGVPRLDWSRAGAPPEDVRFAVLRETARRAPDAAAPGAVALTGDTWRDDRAPDDPLVFYDVRAMVCDGTLSTD